MGEIVKARVGILFCLAGIFAVMTFSIVFGAGGERQSSADILAFGNDGDVTISTWQFTAVPSTGSTNKGRLGILISHYAGNNGNFILRLTTDTTVPSSTGMGLTFKPNDPPWLLSISGFVYLWATSTGTATTDKLYYREVK